MTSMTKTRVEVFAKRADDAVAAGIDLADAVLVSARGLDHARGAGVDDGGHPARLCIEGISRFHIALCHLSAAKTRSRISATEPMPEIFLCFGARGSPRAAHFA